MQPQVQLMTPRSPCKLGHYWVAVDLTTNQTSAATLTINHDAVSRTNKAHPAQPSAGNTFTAVDQVTSDSYGHITGVNTKTVTMPDPGTAISLTDPFVGSEGSAAATAASVTTTVQVSLPYTPPTAAGIGALTAHPNISAASSSNNSGDTFIQDITLDSNGHVTALAVGTASGTTTTLGAVGTYAWLGKSSAGTITAGTSYAGSGSQVRWFCLHVCLQ